MNSMNDQRFFDLAMKAIAHQANDAERAELEALLAREPEWRSKFDRLDADARLAKEALPLVEAMRSEAGEFPASARGRLQTKVRQTLGRPAAQQQVPERSPAWGWRWGLALAAAAALVLLVALPIFRAPNAPVIQIAMLDTAGGSRGTDANEMALLRETWPTATLNSLTNAQAFRAWEMNAALDAVRVIYDRAAAEVRVTGKWRGKSFEKAFLVERDLAAALQAAKSFIASQTRK